MAGLALLWLAEGLFPDRNFFWLDPVAALVVAVLIIKAAYDLTSQSAKDLLDVHLPSVELEWIREKINEQAGIIHGFHDLRTRKAGHFRFIEFHLKVESLMSVMDSHAIAKELSNEIKIQFPNTTVTIHIEPCDGKCVEKCIGGCFLPEQKREEKRKICS